MRLPLVLAVAATALAGTQATATAYVAHPDQGTYVGWTDHAYSVHLRYHAPSVKAVTVHDTVVLSVGHVFEGSFSTFGDVFHVWGYWRDQTHLHGGYSWEHNGTRHIHHFDLVPYAQAYTPGMS